MLRSSSILFLSLALVACGGTDTTADSGTPGTDAGTDGGSVGTDSGPRPDSGPGDLCEAEPANASSTVGCNGGFISGEQPADADFGPCTGGDDADPNGSCTAASSACFAAAGEPGICFPLCDPGTSYVSTGGCPDGSRCFPVGEGVGACFRDCDATHPCPDGQECDPDGSCLPEEAPPADGGAPPADGGIVLPDASIEVDASLPDAGIAG